MANSQARTERAHELLEAHAPFGWCNAITGPRNASLHWCITAVASALLELGSKPPSGWWGIGVVAWIPWFHALSRSKSWGETLLGSALIGFAIGCTSGSWVPEALRGLTSGPLQALTGLGLASIWVTTIPFVLMSGCVFATVRLRPAIRTLAVAFCAYGLSWMALSWRWGVPWSLLGHSQLGWGAAQLAAFGGVSLVSAWLAAVNFAISEAIGRTRSASSFNLAASLVAGWMALAMLGLPLARLVRPEAASPEITLLIVQPNLPRGERWDPGLQKIHLRRIGGFSLRELAGLSEAPDAIVWPENLVTSPADEGTMLREELQAWVDRLGVPVITGAVRAARSDDAGLYRSSVLWLEPGSGERASLDKVRGVPAVESSQAPFGGTLLEPAFGRAAAFGKVEESDGAGPLRGSFTAVVVLCYEALFPGLVQARRTPDSVVILNLADDSWVSGERATRQLASFAAFRAIEQRLPLVRVAHGGLTTVIDEFGQTTLELPLDTYASAVVRVTARPTPKWGERTAIVVLPIAVSLGVWFALRRLTKAFAAER